MGPGMTAASTLHFCLVLRQHLVAQSGVLHVEGNHLAQAEAQHGVGFSGLGGQGIEVQHKDAHHRIRQHQGDGARARRNLAKGRANRGCNSFRGAQIRLADAGTSAPAGSGWKA
jgi:50S ribosomal subunit-associated GTPase HflX